MSWIITCSYLKKYSVEIENLPDAIIITVSCSLNFRQLFGDKLKQNGHLFYWNHLLCAVFVFRYLALCANCFSSIFIHGNYSSAGCRWVYFLMRVWSSSGTFISLFKKYPLSILLDLGLDIMMGDYLSFLSRI